MWGNNWGSLVTVLILWDTTNLRDGETKVVLLFAHLSYTLQLKFAFHIWFDRLSETSSTLSGRTVPTESRKQSHVLTEGRIFTNSQALEHPRLSETSVSPRKEFHLQNLDLGNDRTTYCHGRKSTEIVFSTQISSSPPSTRGHHYPTSPVPSRTFGQCQGSPSAWQDDSRSSSSPQPLPLPPGPSCLPSRSLQWKKGKLLGSGTFGQVYLGFNRCLSYFEVLYYP